MLISIDIGMFDLPIILTKWLHLFSSGRVPLSNNSSRTVLNIHVGQILGCHFNIDAGVYNGVRRRTST
jgi:hypothetical protein